ncbi:uncharacterized protein LOC116295009 [Actinia tenebrosa]|uniref:Uncharacterized protein LOC116295009 n=1 Tax=Actinia tenebrosa TaxID=6105 RepID=A0A6P8HT05_ACTTE|nr:uncharacterized protein LOC116295009 [Actinia tenebrosa]
MAASNMLVFILVVLVIQHSCSNPLLLKRYKRQSARPTSPVALNPSVIGSLMAFSQKLSSMESTIKAQNEKIQKQNDMIEDFENLIADKASMFSVNKLAGRLQGKVSVIMADLEIRKMDITRYRDKMRVLEGLQSTTEADFVELRSKANMVENRFDGFDVTCRRARTSWNHRADGELMFLDRHNVQCRSNEFIQTFVLKRRSDYPQGMVRYEFKCCRYNL